MLRRLKVKAAPSSTSVSHMWQVTPWYSELAEPILFFICAVMCFVYRRRAFSPLLWIPATLYWMRAVYFIWVQTDPAPSTGWWGEAVFDLLLYAARILAFATLALCTASVPRSRPTVGMVLVGFAALAAAVLLPRTALHVLEAQRYEFVFTDSFGRPLPNVRVDCTYIAPTGDKVEREATGDAQGRATITVYGHSDFEFSAHGALSRQSVSVDRWELGHRWTAVFQRDGRPVLIEDWCSQPLGSNHTIPVQFQMTADYDGAILYREWAPTFAPGVHDFAQRWRSPGVVLLDQGQELLDQYVKDSSRGGRPASYLRDLLDVLEGVGEIQKDERTLFLADLGTFDNQPSLTLSEVDQRVLREHIHHAQEILGKAGAAKPEPRTTEEAKAH